MGLFDKLLYCYDVSCETIKNCHNVSRETIKNKCKIMQNKFDKLVKYVIMNHRKQMIYRVDT